MKNNLSVKQKMLITVNKFLVFFICLFVIQQMASQSLTQQWVELINQGKVKYSENSFSYAYDYFLKASKLIPTDTTAFVYMMDCAYKINNSSAVYQAFDNLKFLNYIKPDFYEIAIAAARDIDNNYEKAFSFSTEGKSKFPNSVSIFFEEAKVYYQSGNYTTAIQKLSQLIEMDKQNDEIHQLLVHIYVNDLENYDKALETLFRAQNYMPGKLEFHIQESDIYIRRKEFDKAQSKIEKLIGQNPENPILYYNLALIYFEKGEYLTSADICKKALEYNPDYYEAIYNVGTFYYYEGLNYNAALSDMSVEQYTFNNQGREFENAAIANFEEAKPYFENAVKLNAEDLDAFENLTTINVLLDNLYALRSENIPQTQRIAPEQVVNIGQPFLFINDLKCIYPNGESIRKGEKGYISFNVENLGNKPGINLEVVILQPVIISGLVYDDYAIIDSINPGEKIEVKIPLLYHPNSVNSKGIEKIEGAENKLRVFIKEGQGFNADLSEIKINLSGEKTLGDASITIAETEDIEFSPKSLPKNYLFILAIDEYSYWKPLKNAVNDAKMFKEILLSKYSFEKDHLFELYNKDATLDNIRNGLIKIKNEITPSDNLIIYFAGHGDYDPEFDEGAWVPVDAHPEKSNENISNKVLLEYLKKLESFHTFLIADACFSGSLLVADNKISYEPGNDKLPSKWVFSSGNIEFVADGAEEDHSPFASFLIESLKDNNRDKISATDIIGYVKYKVKTVADQTPVGKPLNISGNEGGEYVFYIR